MIRSGMLLLGALLAAPLAAGRAVAQGRTDPRLEARLETSLAETVQATLDSAASAALPTEPLVLKALEGASKGARGPQIVAAVSRLHAQLRTTRDALGASSDAAEIIAGTAALQAGVSTGTLERMRAARAAGSLTVALSVLADLVSRGVPVDTASEIVLALVGSGAPDSQLASYRHGVERDIRGGIAPGTAAMQASRRLPPGLPASVGIPPKGPPDRGRPPSP